MAGDCMKNWKYLAVPEEGLRPCTVQSYGEKGRREILHLLTHCWMQQTYISENVASPACWCGLDQNRKLQYEIS